jgi:periplasmic protein TonB
MDSKYLNTQLDDVIFESRNKAYGAYALRQSYGKRMKQGMFFGLSFFALLVSSPLIANRMKAKTELMDNRVIEMAAIKPDVPKTPIAPPPPPPPVKQQMATTRFEPPVVTEEAETEPPMPRVDDITTNVSTQTQKGDNSEAFVNVVEAPAAPPIDVPVKTVVEEPKTFEYVEQMPEYPDGMKAMFRFLSEHVKYPAVARENGIEETIYIGFVVGNDGTIRNVNVKRGKNSSLNEEAVRVVSMMPKWKAGRQNGKAVNVAYTLPIKFHLD